MHKRANFITIAIIAFCGPITGPIVRIGLVILGVLVTLRVLVPAIRIIMHGINKIRHHIIIGGQ